MESIKHIKEVKDIGDIARPIYGYKEVETDFVQQYKNCIASLFKLTPLATKYILFATEQMTMENIYRNDIYNKELFISKMVEVGEKQHSIGSLDKVALELVDNNIFLRLNRGTYKINPELFWKDDAKARRESIKLSLEFEINTDMKIKVEKDGK